MKILTIPNKILTTKAEDVTDFSHVLVELYSDMMLIATKNNLIGLAANQIGILQRIFIMDVSSPNQVNYEGEHFLTYEIFINPKTKVNQTIGKAFEYEGCGSVPNIHCLVERWKGLTLTYTNLQGENCTEIFTGLLARVIQHEIAHLNGILMTSQAREIIRGK